MEIKMLNLTLKQKLIVAKNFIIELPMEVLAFIVVPIAVAFTKKDDEHLPKWARWFEDADDIYDGKSSAINGDSGWRTKHYPEPKNRSYIARVKWLLRNRIGNFSAKYLGVKFKEINPLTIKYEGDLRAFNIDGKERLECKVTALTFSGKESFCIFKSLPYSKRFYVRIFLGHKIQDIAFIADLKTADEKLEAMKKYLDDKENKKVAKSVWAFHPIRKVG